MIAYIDTNVIMAKYLPQDPYHKSSKTFLNSAKGENVVSPLTVVELTAVIARHAEELQAPDEILPKDSRRRIRSVVEFFLRDSNLTTMSVHANARTKIAKSILTVPLEYVTSLRLASALKLKTLDLMHLAYAENIRSSGRELDWFVTTDKDIVKKSDHIERLLSIKVKEPNEGI
jgi:predicted nucleic acid-binding protein